MIAERLDHFGVREFQQPRALFDQRDAHAERRKHASVFDTDNPAAHHDQRFGNFRHAQDLVAVDDVAVVKGNESRFRRLGARADDDVGGFIIRLILGADHVNVRGVGEAGHAGQHFDAVARELRANDVNFGFDDVLRAEGKIGHGDLILHAIVHAVDVLVVESGEVQDRLANRFARNRPCIDGRAAHDFELFNQRDALAELGCLNRRALACRPRTNDDEVVLFHGERSIEAGSISPLNRCSRNGHGRVNGCPLARHPSHNRARTDDTFRGVSA